jgi:RNA polymerase sigma factor (sigma-70 family)
LEFAGGALSAAALRNSAPRRFGRRRGCRYFAAHFFENARKSRTNQKTRADSRVTTARRETLHFLRQRQKAPQYSLDAGEEGEFKEREFAAAEPLADEILLELERQHRVRAAVAALDERCRNLIILLFYREPQIPYSEIARILGISEGGIGPTRARCLKKLLERLNKPPERKN